MSKTASKESLAGFESAAMLDQMLTEQMMRRPVQENPHYWISLARALRNSVDRIEEQALRALDP